MPNAQITGWGKCLPPAVLTNDDLAAIMDTSDEWIVERTGIHARRISHVNCSELALVAAQQALAAAGLDANDIGMIVFASASPDLLIPNTASRLQQRLGNKSAAAFDLNSGCTGFVYGLKIADDHLNNYPDKPVLLVGAERLTWYLDWTQRDSAVLFGDGAGAVVLQAGDNGAGVIRAHLGCEAEAGDALMIPDFGTVMDRFGDDPTHFTMCFDGREVFRHAVRGMAAACTTVLADAGMSADDIDLVIPHQANERIIDSLAHHLGIDDDRVFKNIAEYGNTSAATVPIAIVEALEQGHIKAGTTLLMPVFGAGLTWGSAILRWGE
ncbi:MAG: ketoacyl-ACP synthase III, partial [Gammaproteobacteria bacterium]|nr:ketoacyl-ACP synthase III [Gammaproteobacteria bacterium]